MDLPANFCVAPFLQHTTHPNGSCSPCPYLGGTTWPGDSSNILEQWSSKKLEALRTEFLNNQKSSICERCWHEESNNKRSLRLRLFDPVNQTSDYSFGKIEIIKQQLDNYHAGPIVLTIKNGNLCNAKCRVCHPNDSSRWIEDANKLAELTGKKYYNLNQPETNWTDAQLDEIVSLSSNLVRLELFGGEPTYNKKVAELLNRLADTGLSKNITLYINTNGSVNIPDRLPVVTKFKDIELGVSLDGVGAHFNYIRHGADYNKVIENIRSSQVFFAQTNTKFWIDSISTVSILNVYYLPELKQAVKEILPLAPFWNLLVNPPHLFIKNMPEHVKLAVIKKLGQDEDFQELISVIQQPAEMQYWSQFLEITQGLDNIRNENFNDTFPEFAKIILNE
jgi:organic radical activating enzyme